MRKRNRREKRGCSKDVPGHLKEAGGINIQHETESKSWGRKGRRRTEQEAGRSEMGKKHRKALPGDSPHRPWKALSSIFAPTDAATTGSLSLKELNETAPLSKKRHRSKDLGDQFEAAAKKGNDELNLEINSNNHKIQLVITSPAKKKNN
ncbi:hypothetical protein M758_UG250700 [Ceratodon purpureus]|nr:hypothetical protein M758_UG250700 [Ceratodon purpureus]